MITIENVLKRKEKQESRKRSKLESFGFWLTFFLVILALLIVFLAIWCFRTWAHLSAEELFYHLRANLTGTDSSIVLSGVFWIGIPTILVTILLVVLEQKLRIHWKTIWMMVLNIAIVIAILVPTKIYVCKKLDLDTYFANASNDSTFIEETYVDPSTVDIEFPKTKRNLIYIYLESVETTFSDIENGGAFQEDVIPELTKLAQENEDFSGDSNALNGGYSLNGTTWTMGGMFAQTSGLPLKVDIDGNNMDTMDSFFPTITTLGDILEEKGYHNVFMCGSDATFGGRELYFQEHGNYDILDYDYAKKEGWIKENYKVWWGYEDEKLFSFAKEELNELSKEKEPFNLTLLTVDTHFEDGYVCNLCEDAYEEQYSNVYACSSKQVSEFVEWCNTQDWYENTTIVLCGDHPTMDADYCENVDDSYERKTYTCYINADAEVEDPTLERVYSTFDDFPTTIAALGATIEGNKLGLGVNLFSNEKTMMEEYGYDSFNQALMLRSSFMVELADIDWDSEEYIAREGTPTCDMQTVSYNEKNHKATITVNNFQHMSKDFTDVKIMVTSSDGTKFQKFDMNKVAGTSYTYSAELDLRNYLDEDGWPDCSLSVYATSSGSEHRLTEITSDSCIKHYTSLDEFLDWVKEEGYVLLGSVKGDASFDTSIQTYFAFKGLGFTTDLTGQENVAWIGMSDGENVFERSGENYIYYNGTIGDVKYYLSSSPKENGNSSRIVINDEEFSLKKTGYNFVVYDLDSRKVVDSVTFQNNDSYVVEQND